MILNIDPNNRLCHVEAPFLGYRPGTSMGLQNNGRATVRKAEETSVHRSIYTRALTTGHDSQLCLTHSHSRVLLEVSSATFILLEITWE